MDKEKSIHIKTSLTTRHHSFKKQTQEGIKPSYFEEAQCYICLSSKIQTIKNNNSQQKIEIFSRRKKHSHSQFPLQGSNISKFLENRPTYATRITTVEFRKSTPTHSTMPDLLEAHQAEIYLTVHAEYYHHVPGEIFCYITQFLIRMLQLIKGIYCMLTKLQAIHIPCIYMKLRKHQIGRIFVLLYKRKLMIEWMAKKYLSFINLESQR